MKVIKRVLALMLVLALCCTTAPGAAASSATMRSVLHPDGSGTTRGGTENDRSQPWERAMDETFQVVSDWVKYMDFRLYEGVAVDAKEVPENFRLGFAPYFRRDQLENINDLSTAAKLSGFDWEELQTVDVAIGLFRFERNDVVCYQDMPFVSFVGIFDPQDHSRILGACVQISSIPLQSAQGKRYIESTLYSIEKCLEDSFDLFYVDYYQDKVTPPPGDDPALEGGVPYGGCVATKKQSAALVRYFEKRGWFLDGATPVAQVRPNSAYPQDSTLGPRSENVEQILAYAIKDGLVNKNYRLPQGENGLTTFYHASEQRTTAKGYNYLIRFCATLSGSEGKGYKVILPWIEVIPAKWNKDDYFFFSGGSSLVVPTIFPLSAKEKEAEAFVDKAPGYTSAEMEERHYSESETGCVEEE